jgi:tRNA(fMet)-specific endonuclease VapC
MAAQGILLDTSVVIEHLRGRIDLAEKAPPTEPLFLPLTALGELYKGVLKSSVPEKNKAQLETFLQTVAVLHPDTATALHYAHIAALLESRGTPIPENDIWIAAVAVECFAQDLNFRVSVFQDFSIWIKPLMDTDGH